MAGASPAVKVVGLSRLVATMRAAEIELTELRDVNADVGAKALEAIRDEAPVKSGRLRGNLRKSKAVRTARVTAGSVGVPYAGPVHWGWPARNIAPNPFGVRGLERAQPAIEAIYVRGIQKILDNVKGA